MEKAHYCGITHIASARNMGILTCDAILFHLFLDRPGNVHGLTIMVYFTVAVFNQEHPCTIA